MLTSVCHSLIRYSTPPLTMAVSISTSIPPPVTHQHHSGAFAIIPIATGLAIVPPCPAQRGIRGRWRCICRNDDYRPQCDAEYNRAPTRASPVTTAIFHCYIGTAIYIHINISVTARRLWRGTGFSARFRSRAATNDDRKDTVPGGQRAIRNVYSMYIHGEF